MIVLSHTPFEIIILIFSLIVSAELSEGGEGYGHYEETVNQLPGNRYPKRQRRTKRSGENPKYYYPIDRKIEHPPTMDEEASMGDTFSALPRIIKKGLNLEDDYYHDPSGSEHHYDCDEMPLNTRDEPEESDDREKRAMEAKYHRNKSTKHGSTSTEMKPLSRERPVIKENRHPGLTINPNKHKQIEDWLHDSKNHIQSPQQQKHHLGSYEIPGDMEQEKYYRKIRKEQQANPDEEYEVEYVERGIRHHDTTREPAVQSRIAGYQMPIIIANHHRSHMDPKSPMYRAAQPVDFKVSSKPKHKEICGAEVRHIYGYGSLMTIIVVLLLIIIFGNK